MGEISNSPSLDSHWSSSLQDEDLIAACENITEAEPKIVPPAAPTYSKCCDEPHLPPPTTTAVKTIPPKRRRFTRSPLFEWKRGKLFVTDFTSQLWCELQMWYRLTKPFPQIEYVEPQEVVQGTEIHEERDLAVNTYVPILITSKEDIFALKILNIMKCLLGFHHGMKVQREIHIFGFVEGTYVSGKIDEMRIDPETFDIDLVELKTRVSDELPSKAQMKTHQMQVMLYKKLFDDLVQNKLPRESLAKCMYLSMNKTLGPDIQTDAQQFNIEHATINTLLNKMLEMFQSIPFITTLLVEYTQQKTKKLIGVEPVLYDYDWLVERLGKQMTFWRGKRDPEGVDIEDMWKCARCEYKKVCDWRRALKEEVEKIEGGGDEGGIEGTEGGIEGTEGGSGPLGVHNRGVELGDAEIH